MPSPRIRTVIVNSERPALLAAFWSGLLEVGMQTDDPEAGIFWLEPDTPGGVNLGIQRVASKLGLHTETHLDIAVDDLDATQARVEALGGALVRANLLASGFEWRVMADPDGNEFCVFVDAH